MQFLVSYLLLVVEYPPFLLISLGEYTRNIPIYFPMYSNYSGWFTIPNALLGILVLDIPQSLTLLGGSSGSGCPMRSREASPLVRWPNMEKDEKRWETYGKYGNIWKQWKPMGSYRNKIANIAEIYE